jgi:hypothetical protein
MLDHDPITIREFLGMFDRGDEDSVPPGYFKDSRNVRFITGGVKSREGTSLDTTIGSVKRMAVYKRIGEAQRLLLLDATGQLWDSTNLVTPILSIAAMVDFSVEVMFNRAYITPHNGVTGLAGEKVYVYEGSGVARVAAGTAPTGFTLDAVDSATSGNCETGTHVFAVCFETTSGFLTKPGGFIAFSPSGGKKVDLSLIPVGDSAVAARQIVATKEIIDFNGDFENQEYFIVPGGRIGNNVDTTISISFFDADLVSSADYLLDELSEIPAGVGLMNYRGHLCVWGENLNPSIVRVSKAGEPESHDAVEGFVTVNPGDNGGGVLNCAEYRGQLLMLKDERTYATQDNGQNPAFWEVPSPIDTSTGSSCHGIAQVRDFGDNIQDRLFVASRTGFQLFNGTFSAATISYPIDAIWERITDAYFHTVEAVIDPVEALVYCALPLDGATSPSHVLVGDFQEGLEIDKFKWTLWSFPVAPTSIVVDVNNATKSSVFKVASVTGNVYKLDSAATDDFGTAISSYVQFGHLPFDDDEKIWHFTGVRLRVKGVGSLDFTLYGEDGVRTSFPASLVLSASPGQANFRGFDFTNEKCSVKLGVDGAGERFTLTKFILYTNILWEIRPQ